MSGLWPQLVLVAVLVLLNAAFAGTEMALVSLREGQLQRLEQRSATGALVARLARDPNNFLATIQVGITLAGFLASAAAAVSLAEPLEEPLSFLGGAAGPVSIVVVTLLLAYVTLVFGELAPKRVAMQRAESWALVSARPLSIMSTVTRPVVWLLSHSTDLAVRLMGGDPNLQREEVTEAELREMVGTQATFTPMQRLIIEGAFEISERTLDQVLRPRPDVLVLDADWSARRALEELAASGHSRAPVAHDGNLDDVQGLVHLRDLLDQGDRPVTELVSELLAFPETAGVLSVLHEMQTRRVQLALVVDEHGAAAGIVTVEDLLEEIVGEIYDESDRDVVGVRREADGSLVMPGRFPVHDLVDVGVGDMPEGPYATVAGLVLDLLGRVPQQPGDFVTVAGRTIEVLAVDGRAITEVRISPRRGTVAGATADEPGEPDAADTRDGGSGVASGAG
ncbi:MAG: hemolysin family protein [Acidimicrobiales bacterium]|nr:hemolysin family protein [Acidimicrobiales bacterium]